MQRSVGDVVARLTAEGLAPAGADETASAELGKELVDHMPWYLRAAVGIGAWFATGFLLFAIFTLAGLDDEIARIVIGVAFIGAAVWLRRDATSEFVKWAAVAAALAGDGLIVFGVGQLTNSTIAASVVAVVISAALIHLIPDAVLRFLSTLAGAASLIVGLVAAELPRGFDVAMVLLIAATAYVWRVRLAQRDDATAAMLEPVGYGLAISVFGALLVLTATSHGTATIGRALARELGAMGPIPAVALTVTLVALVWRISDEHGVSATSGRAFAAIAGAAALGFGTLDSPGIVAGATALVLAFDRRDKVLLGMATIFLLAFASFYYYSLHITLLEKSGVLIGSGALLLGIRSRLVKAP